jgi:hypothetical protein
MAKTGYIGFRVPREFVLEINFIGVLEEQGLHRSMDVQNIRTAAGRTLA